MRSSRTKQEIIETLPTSTKLHSIYEIEIIMEMLKDIEDKIDHLKELKRERAARLDDEVSNLDDKSKHFRSIILNTMRELEPKKTTIHFPSVGKITRKKAKEDWQIEDQAAALKFMEEHGVKNQVVRIEEKIDVTEAKKVLQNFDDQNIPVPGTKKIIKDETISVSYEDGEAPAIVVVSKSKSPKSSETKSETKSEPKAVSSASMEL